MRRRRWPRVRKGATYQAREETGLKDTQEKTDRDHAGIAVNATESHGELPSVSPVGMCG